MYITFSVRFEISAHNGQKRCNVLNNNLLTGYYQDHVSKTGGTQSLFLQMYVIVNNLRNKMQKNPWKGSF